MAAIRWPDIPAGDAMTNTQEWRSYFRLMQEQLSYGFENIDLENFSAHQRNAFNQLREAAGGVSAIFARLDKLAISEVLARLIDTVDGLTTVFYSETAPESPKEGDLWYDKSQTPVAVKRWESNAWVDITNDVLSAALAAAAEAQATADGKVRIFTQAEEPEEKDTGDLWVDTAHGNQLKRWSGTEWVNIDNQLLANIERDQYGNLVIKSSDGVYKAIHTPTGIEFRQSDATIGRFYNNRLEIGRADIYDQLTMGTSTKGYYDLVTDINRLTLKYREA